MKNCQFVLQVQYMLISLEDSNLLPLSTQLLHFSFTHALTWQKFSNHQYQLTNSYTISYFFFFCSC